MVKAQPDQYHTVTPYLIVDNASGLIDFAKEVFGAEEMMRMPGQTPDKIGHAEMKIGDSIVMLSDGNDQYAPGAASLLLYLEDCDATYRKALDSGATSASEPADQFYGDRAAEIRAFGVHFYLHTHTEDVSPEEMEKRMASMAGAPS
jgi:PhnB protein